MQKVEKDESLERIKSCMAMESVCSSVYHLLSLNFQDEKELWNKLALDDESHVEMIASILESRETDNPSEFPVPEELENIRNTIAYGREMRKLLVNNKLPLRDALKRLEVLHELKIRSYSLDLMEKEKDEKIRDFFSRLFRLDKSNMDMIKTFVGKFKS